MYRASIRWASESFVPSSSEVKLRFCHNRGCRISSMKQVGLHSLIVLFAIASLRFVTNPEHRFFIALLLNVDDRETVFKLVKSRFPNADPIEKILDWTYDLAQTRVLGVNIPNALGIEGFDDVDLSIVEHLLRGKSEAEMLGAIETEYGSEKAGGAGEKLRRLRASSMFRTLLA